MQYFTISFILLIEILFLILSIIYNSVPLTILAVLLFFINLIIFKDKPYNVSIYINDRLVKDKFNLKINSLVDVQVFMEYKNGISINITNSMILVSSDPVIATILPSAKFIKTNIIADECKIFIKHHNPKFWRILKLYGKFKLIVDPGPPRSIEIYAK